MIDRFEVGLTILAIWMFISAIAIFTGGLALLVWGLETTALVVFISGLIAHVASLYVAIFAKIQQDKQKFISETEKR